MDYIDEIVEIGLKILGGIRSLQWIYSFFKKKQKTKPRQRKSKRPKQ